MIKAGVGLGVIAFAVLFGATMSVTAQPHQPVVKKQAKKLSAAQLASLSGALTEMGAAREPSQLDAQSRALMDRAIAALADGKQEAALQSFGELVKGKKLAEARNLARYVVLRSYAADPVIPGLAAQAHRLSAQRGALATHTKKLDALLAKSKAEKTRHRVPILTLQPTGPKAYSVKEVDIEVTREDVLAAIASAKTRATELSQLSNELNQNLQNATQEYEKSFALISGVLRAFTETARSVVQNVK